MKISIIGSFRRHYELIQPLISRLRQSGHEIGSPKGDEIIERDQLFVRFSSDENDFSDAQVQSIALHRILSSDIVYVLDYRGYIGRTTCYEVGRIIQASKPLYFSSKPKDLPIYVPSGNIIPYRKLVKVLGSTEFKPASLYSDQTDKHQEIEISLANERYLDL